MPTFGKTTTDNDGSSGIDNAILGSKFTMGSIGGTADSMTVYMRQNDSSGSSECKCAIYDTSYNLIGETEAKNISGDALHWETFNFSGTVNLSANTDYWLVIWGDVLYSPTRYCFVAYEDSVETDDYVYDTAKTYVAPDPSFDDPWTPDGTGSYRKYALYCTYTEGGETHAPSDTAKATDSINTSIDHPFSDTAKATDSMAPKVSEPFSDIAKATDSIAFKVFHSVNDTAKAQDIIFPDKLTLTDVAKANDSVVYSYETLIEDPTENCEIWR